MEEPLFLIDAYSQIFRGFYAIAGLTNSQGEPTNALFAVSKLLLRLEKEYPTHLGAAVFDCGRVQFRQALNPQYKANRPPMPDPLKQQIPGIRELMQAFGWPILEHEEYEADDLIAALAAHAEVPVRILSSDKDISQSICARVSMLIPDKGGMLTIRDEAGVLTRFGVSPERIVDYLALTGDAADNIPGVQGVGPKRAAALIAETGGVDAMIAHPELIANEKFRAKITESAALLKRNMDLIRLRTDLPAECANWRSVCEKSAPDFEQIADLWKHAELKSLLKELPDSPMRPTAAAMEQGELF